MGAYMNWKQLLSIAAIIMALGFFVRSFQTAYAFQGASVSLGANPYKSFYGTVASGISTTVLNVPSDRNFILTTMISNRDRDYYNSIIGDQWCILKVDGVDVIGGNRTVRQSEHAFIMGNAHLVISANSLITMEGDNATCHYYVDGYFVQP